jgi:hypothetical protein
VAKFADLKKLKVGVQTGTTGDEAVTKLLGKTSTNIKRFESTPLALKELESGGVDAVVADNGVIIHYVANNPGGKFKTVADKEFVPEQYGIAVKKGNTELQGKINKGLADIRPTAPTTRSTPSTSAQPARPRLPLRPGFGRFEVSQGRRWICAGRSLPATGRCSWAACG